MKLFSCTFIMFSALAWTSSVLSEEYDYGTKMLKWVREDAARQSVELAKADHAARDLNLIISTINLGGTTIGKLNTSLVSIASTSEMVEKTAINLSPTEAAFLRRADSATHIDTLLAIGASLQSVQNHLNLAKAPHTKSQFTSFGLPAVGRQTMMESFTTVSNSLKPNLPEAYFEVRYSYENGEETYKVGGETAPAYYVASALMKYPNPYAYAAGVALLATAFTYDVLKNDDLKKKIEEQNRLLAQAYSELQKILPADEKMYEIYLEAVKQHRGDVESELKSFATTLVQANIAWNHAMALQMARSRQSASILSEARLKKVIGDTQDPARRFFNTALTIKLADESSEFMSKAVQEVKKAITGCGDAFSAQDYQNTEDTLYEGSYIFEAISRDPALAELHDLASSASKQLLLTSEELSVQRKGILSMPCGSKAESDQTRIQNHIQALTNMPLPKISSQDSALLKYVLDERFVVFSRNVSESSSMTCQLYRTDSGLSCNKGSASDQPYDQGLHNGGNPIDIITGRRDGGYSNDARQLSDRADQGKLNVDKRVANLNKEYNELKSITPNWKASTSGDLVKFTDELGITTRQHESGLSNFANAHASELGDMSRRMQDFASAPFNLNSAAVIASSVTGVTSTFPTLDPTRVRSEGPHFASLDPRPAGAGVSLEVARSMRLQAESEQAVRKRVSDNLRADRRDPVFSSIGTADENAHLAQSYLKYAERLSNKNGDAYLRFGPAAERAARAYIAEATMLRRYAEGDAVQPPDGRHYIGDWPFNRGRARDELARFISCTSEHGDNPDLTDTACNKFSYKTLEALYTVRPDEFVIAGQIMMANQLAVHVATSPNWSQIGSIRDQSNIDEAAQLAVEGHAVIGVYHNPNPGGHGHVFVVLPAVPTYIEKRPEYANAWGGLRQPQIANFALNGCGSETPFRCYIDGPPSQGIRFLGPEAVSSIILWVRKYP